MAGALGLVEAGPAGEDEVRSRKQFGFEREEFGRREAEGGQLVHAVVDGAGCRDVARKGQHHGRVVPSHRDRRFACQEPVEQRGKRGVRLFAVEPGGQLRDGDAHAPFLADRNGGRPGPDLRLFPEHHGHPFGEAGHEMLGPLEHEVPAQVRKAEKQAPLF